MNFQIKVLFIDSVKGTAVAAPGIELTIVQSEVQKRVPTACVKPAKLYSNIFYSTVLYSTQLYFTLFYTSTI